jgi:8-oxo-dGTP diphosphatase
MGRYCYDYPRPAVSSDCVLFGFDGQDLSVLLVERGKDPYKGRWAFPGGFMNMDETSGQCALRELKEETGVEGIQLEQLGAFSDVDRDPRGRVISVVYLALVKLSDHDPVAGDDAAKAQWFRVRDTPPLAFDHDLVMLNALERLKVDIHPVRNILFPASEEITAELLEELIAGIQKHA